MDRGRIMTVLDDETGKMLQKSTMEEALNDLKNCKQFFVITFKDGEAAIQMALTVHNIHEMLEAFGKATESLAKSMCRRPPTEDRKDNEQKVG